MDEFNEIKVGDHVLVSVSLSWGWGHSKSFKIKQKVTKITKTQFVVGERRFKKESGREIGQGSYASAIGTHDDEREAYKEFRKKISIYSDVKSNMYESYQESGVISPNLPVTVLEEIRDKSKAILKHLIEAKK